MTHSVKIPADVDREDRVLAGFTARQVAVLALAGLVLYGGWQATRTFLPVIIYLIVAVPVGVAVAALVLLRRDGLSLDQLMLAALRQRLRPRHCVATAGTAGPVPEWLAEAADAEETTTSGLELPARTVNEAGVIDLGADGLAVVAVCSTVNFALRTPAEQEALTAAFGRYLHSLTAPAQILVRTERLDLSAQIEELRDRAARLPHPALEEAALDHADYLAQLAEQTDLLRRQILLVLHESVAPTPQNSRQTEPDDAARRAAATRLMRRLGEASELLSPADITVTPLDAPRATGVLTAACNPDSFIPASAELAAADDVITTHYDDGV